MIENEKVDCIDSLIFGLNRTALWRQKMAAKYPTDPRNGRAAECLAELATDAAELKSSETYATQFRRVLSYGWKCWTKPAGRFSPSA